MDAAHAMIDADERVKGEYYVCPSFNRAIAGGARVRTMPVVHMWGIGVPEDLDAFLKDGPPELAPPTDGGAA